MCFFWKWTEVLFKIFLNLEVCLMSFFFFSRGCWVRLQGWRDVLSAWVIYFDSPLSHHAYSVSKLIWGPEGYFSVEAVRRFMWCIMLHVTFQDPIRLWTWPGQGKWIIIKCLCRGHRLNAAELIHFHDFPFLALFLKSQHCVWMCMHSKSHRS